MIDYDQKVKEWVADRLNVPVGKVASIEFENYIDCYSSWTCNYGTEIKVTLTDGKRRLINGWSFPQALQDFSDWVEAQDRLADEHHTSHGWHE